ncbi:MFS transporter [Streptomyces sp. NPDC008343]|uniref:MFS transporter n=1 Tax=Streptomyces sp. NPDC008343 TaxID=3364828 RepID=UPI0036EF5427
MIEKYGIEVDVDAELEERDAPAKEGFGALFHRRHLRSRVFTSVFWAALVLPYFAIGTFWTQVFEALNMGDNAVAALLVYSFTAVAGVTAGCLVVDRIGRRRLLIPPFWITAGCLALVALWPTSTPVIVGGFLFFIFLNAASSALTAVYPLEVFPTALRTTGVGFATAMSRVGAAIGTFLLPMGLERFGAEFGSSSVRVCSPSVVCSRSSWPPRPRTWTSPGQRARHAGHSHRTPKGRPRRRSPTLLVNYGAGPTSPRRG